MLILMELSVKKKLFKIVETLALHLWKGSKYASKYK